MAEVPIKKELTKLEAFGGAVYEGLDLDRLVIFAMMSLEQKKPPFISTILRWVFSECFQINFLWQILANIQTRIE